MDNSSVGDSFDVGSFECTLFQKLFLLANQQQTRIKMIVRGQVVLRLSPLPAPSPSRGRGRGWGGGRDPGKQVAFVVVTTCSVYWLQICW